MVTEWEELEKLSKDELIIELVRQRWLYRDLKMTLRNLSSDFRLFAGAPGEIPPEEWQKKIAEYVFPNVKTEDMKIFRSGVWMKMSERNSIPCISMKTARRGHPNPDPGCFR